MPARQVKACATSAGCHLERIYKFKPSSLWLIAEAPYQHSPLTRARL